MDPLSITASIWTLLGACSIVLETFKKIREIRRVPEVLYSLNNEVADLKLVLLEIHDLREEFFRTDIAELNSRERRLLDACHGLLEQTWSKVHEAEVLINSSIRTTGQNLRSRLHVAINARENGRLARLQIGIREAKENIQSLWGQLDRRHSSQIQVQLNSIQETSTNIRSQLLEGNQVLQEDSRRIERKLDKLLEMERVLSSPLPSLDTNISTNISSAIRGTRRIDVTLTRLPYMQTNFPKHCRCRDKTRSFSYAHSFLGDLFLGYAATPLFSTHSPDCCYSLQAETVLVYCFPIWFLNYALALRAKYDTVSGIDCALSVRPVLPHTHVAWDIAQSGDVERLKSLLGTGKIALEVRDPNGYGFLIYAISFGRSDMVTFLRKIGADREAESHEGRTPYHFAWDKILYDTTHEEYSSRLTVLFPDPDFDGLYEFSEVHKAVLGLETGADPVEHVVWREPSIINKTDRFGRSPLSWAAMQGNEETVELLLSLKAQVDQPNQIGSSPLMQAAHFGKLGSVRRLLDAGADPSRKNKFGMTALHYLMQSKTEAHCFAEMAESLLDAGSDINAVNAIGETPLASAVYTGASNGVELLINRGANLDVCINGGHSPLSIAVQQNRHSILKALLECGRDHLDSLLQFGTFMHLVAHQADAETLRLLLDYRLKPRDINIRDREGLTAFQVGARRENQVPEWSGLFEQFLYSIDRDTPTPVRDPEPAPEYSFQWPMELVISETAEQVIEDTNTELSSSLTAIDSESSSEDEFVDAVQRIGYLASDT